MVGGVRKRSVLIGQHRVLRKLQKYKLQLHINIQKQRNRDLLTNSLNFTVYQCLHFSLYSVQPAMSSF